MTSEPLRGLACAVTGLPPSPGPDPQATLASPVQVPRIIAACVAALVGGALTSEMAKAWQKPDSTSRAAALSGGRVLQADQKIRRLGAECLLVPEDAARELGVSTAEATHWTRPIRLPAF